MRCKVGDLAVIVGERSGRHDGLIVEVLCYMGRGPVSFMGSLWYEDTHDVWLVRCPSGSLEPEYGGRLTEAPIPDHCLRPIRAGDVSEETEEPLHQHEERTFHRTEEM